MRKPYLIVADNKPSGTSWAEHFAGLGLQHPGLPCVADYPNACVFAGSDVSIARKRGVTILGPVHAFAGGGRIGGAETARGDGIFGECLDAWGDYIAVIGDTQGAHVLRAPFGRLPCYYVRWKSAVILVSDIRVLKSIGLPVPALDWDAVGRFLIAPELRAEATCLDRVWELVGGCSLTILHGDIHLRTAWSPWPFASRRALLRDAREARIMLRRTIDEVVGAHCRQYTHILLGVSGGLDSSIVAAVAARARVQTTLVTMAASDRAGDERAYARILAGRLRLPLIEAFEDVARVDVHVSRSGHLPRPHARSFAQSSDDALIALAKARGIDAFFSGAGGDNIFWNLTSAASVADTCLGGFGSRATFRNALDLADMCGASVPHVLLKALRSGLSRRQVPWPTDGTFIADAAGREISVHDHPWLGAPAGILPGKVRHVHCIMGIENHLEGYGREAFAPMAAPLLSQPLVEACLRIPTWMWCMGGHDRALARAAFADCLPAAILTRTEKGTPFGFALQLFEKNRAALRDMLLDGVLARERLLDLTAVETCLARDDPAAGLAHYRLLCIADVEAWVRHREALRAGS
ncbi:asparagine synthase C-terminal domain-containing protein [Sphingosinicella sp.]|uniref:asparagine synthase-related protein n=1 Tax=Sphingosinicella sp. TaxID=1917971 RepID=UPI001791F4CF|nr:asparagine synthase C-terminal domain-containing protein [Sphingosinicella sp.]MBA4758983.1 asparagine synthase [Sphingosinicella sp.]